MSGKLMATLFIPYLLISILGTITDNTFGLEQTEGEQMVDQMYDARIATGSGAGTASFAGGSNASQKLMSGLSMLGDATGLVFGFAAKLFKVLTLNYSFWSGCYLSSDDDPGYDTNGALLTAGTGTCFIEADGEELDSAPMAYVMVRYFLLILALPAIFVLTFKTAELFSRMVSALGSALGVLTGFIGGLR